MTCEEKWRALYHDPSLVVADRPIHIVSSTGTPEIPQPAAVRCSGAAGIPAQYHNISLFFSPVPYFGPKTQVLQYLPPPLPRPTPATAISSRIGFRVRNASRLPSYCIYIRPQRCRRLARFSLLAIDSRRSPQETCPMCTNAPTVRFS